MLCTTLGSSEGSPVNKVLVIAAAWVLILGAAVVCYCVLTRQDDKVDKVSDKAPPPDKEGKPPTPPEVDKGRDLPGPATTPHDPTPQVQPVTPPKLAPPAAPERMAPEEAAKKIGQHCKVEMVVRSTYKSKDQGHVFLNSQRDSDVPGNLTVAVFDTAAAEVQTKLGAFDLASYFPGRKIHVSGDVREYMGRPEIVVNSANQIDVVADGK
jgi:hypothetical protein